MDDTERIKDILESAEKILQKPEKYVCLQDETARQIELLTKMIYDYTKFKETNTENQSDILENLIINNFDEEQIWQEIELQNNAAYNFLMINIAKILAKRKWIFKTCGKPTSNKSFIAGNNFENDLHFSESENENSEEEIKELKYLKKEKKTSAVDDKFFKMSEMEDFLNKVENENFSESSDESVDLFADDSHESDSAFHYDDFFDPLEDKEVVKSNTMKRDFLSPEELHTKKKKKVSFASNPGFNAETGKREFFIETNAADSQDPFEYEYEEDKEEDAQGKDEDEDEQEEEEEKNIDNLNKSSYESRQERLRARINALEKEALKEKPWQLKGEITASRRPQNSLLEEYVEFDIASRPPPIITEKSTLKLEDVIRQRIKDKVWDDVVRKIKPTEDPKEYKKKLILNQEKSKLSLAEIYEKEYLKEKKGKAEEISEEESNEHAEIKKGIKILFAKLDALSNFHCTPKQVSPEVKIISHLPAVEIEEVAPVAVSDATLLAPEEIKAKPKGDFIGKTERSTTDKKRERRKKILQQKWKRKEKEKRDKTVEKLNLGMGNKYSKDKAKKLLEKITKEKNVSQLDADGEGKYVKSSNLFFSKLQDEVASHVRKKGTEMKKIKNNKLEAKKIKF